MSKKMDRFCLDFPPGSKEEFEELKKSSGLSTITELFRRAINAYNFIMTQQKAGWRFTMEHSDKEKEVVRFL